VNGRGEVEREGTQLRCTDLEDLLISSDFSSDIESLKKGIIKTSKNKVPYTILLIGETGVGKSSLLELIANVLHGNDVDHYDFDILDHTNEQGGSNNQSQTNSAQLYEFTSKNGVVVSAGCFERGEYA
jgi:putative ribosome biogenesis GTPase RsgA